MLGNSEYAKCLKYALIGEILKLKALLLTYVLIPTFLFAFLDKSYLIGKYENGVVSTSILTYKHPLKNKTIHVVGIIHYGTKDYYHRIENYLKSLTPGTPILEEFTKCESLETLVLDMDMCDEKTTQEAWSKSLFPSSLEKLVNIGQNNINQMVNTGFLSIKRCESDPVSNIPRPPSILNRNRQRCEKVRSEGLVCQHDMYNSLRPSNLIPIHSDVTLTSSNKGEHLLASLLYSSTRKDGCSRRDVVNYLYSNQDIQSQAYSLNNSINQFNLTHRDNILFNTLFKALKAHDTVAILWGAAHSIAIDKNLKEHGYKLLSVDDIHYMDDNEGGSWSGYQQLIDSLKFNPYQILE